MSARPPPPPRLALSSLVVILLIGITSTLFTGVEAKSLGPVQSCIELVPTRARSSVFGVIHTCGPRRRLKLWGANYGQLGADNNIQIGGTSHPAVSSALPWVKGMGTYSVLNACVGLGHTCVLLGTSPDATSGDVKCFGMNERGQLGLGHQNRRGDVPGSMDALPFVNLGGAKVSAVECGTQTTCVIMAVSKRVKCFGLGSNGELGNNRFGAVGVSANQMGANLGDVRINKNFVSVKPGSSTCGLTSAHEVFCWGGNANGELGIGSSATAVGNSAGSMETLTPVNLGLVGDEYVENVYAGHSVACAVITNNGRKGVKCWGQGSSGVLGYENTNDVGKTPASMGGNLPYVNLGGRSVLKLAVGSLHVCALFESLSVACWGSNSWGERGVDTTISAGHAANTMGSSLRDVKIDKDIWDITAGAQANLVVAGPYRQLYTWGSNVQGLLGRNDVVRTGTLIHEMSRLKALDLGLCVVRNFLEMGEDFHITPGALGGLATVYYIRNPLESASVVVNVQGPGFLTSADFNKPVEIAPLTTKTFVMQLAAGSPAAWTGDITASYYCKGDPDAVFPLPVIYVTYGAATRSPTSLVPSTKVPTTMAPSTRPPSAPTVPPPTTRAPTTRAPTPPTSAPSRSPTAPTAPTAQPTNRVTGPTKKPTKAPTKRPTKRPTKAPTRKATKSPTTRPTKQPTKQPTKRPSKTPTERPTRRSPTKRPTRAPTKRPTTRTPTKRPTKAPTMQPTTRTPTVRPSTMPTTPKPTTSPTLMPTRRPSTSNPSKAPTLQPTRRPTREPTAQPTKRPTKAPTKRPTKAPTNRPTKKPTRAPTRRPTKRPAASG